MASTEKTPTRSKPPADAAPDVHDGVDANAADEPTAAAAVHELTDTLGRAWNEARGTVNQLGVDLGKRAKNVRNETRRAASEARETLGDAATDMAELGEEIAEDAIELGRVLGVGVSRFVRKHPVRSIAIAAAAGAVFAHLLRGRRRD
jgi:ElaB/YqjD/DUF883 family membrane-anchored ribosome-binding protein